MQNSPHHEYPSQRQHQDCDQQNQQVELCGFHLPLDFASYQIYGAKT